MRNEIRAGSSSCRPFPDVCFAQLLTTRRSSLVSCSCLTGDPVGEFSASGLPEPLFDGTARESFLNPANRLLDLRAIYA